MWFGNGRAWLPLLFLCSFSARGFNVDDHTEKANDLYRNGRLLEAEAMYRLVLDHQADHADVACNLGSLLQDLNRPDEAIESYRNAIAAQPNHADAHFNLGVMYQDGLRLSDSEESYMRALSLDPEHPEATANLGSVLQAQDKFEEAEEAYRTAIEVVGTAPSLDDDERIGMLMTLHYSLGTILDRFEVTSGVCHGGVPCKDAAISAYQTTLKYNPDHALALHALAAHLADGSVTTASREYVTTLFDDYADTFDESLTGLEYRAPDAVAAALYDVIKKRYKSNGKTPQRAELRTTLDAGCGTGLLGTLLRSMTHTLIGVDLSKKMVARAHEREIYDELIVGDIEETLVSLKGRLIDLVAAADVFVYFGDMKGIFEKVAEVLTPGGFFTFTTELLEEASLSEASAGFHLQSSGRFSHTKGYLGKLAMESGFAVVHHESIVPRIELGKPIKGQLFVFSLMFKFTHEGERGNATEQNTKVTG